ncbi:MAG: hypothetical protein ACOYUZ_04800 [Patescibacteria group bacterium]
MSRSIISSQDKCAVATEEINSTAESLIPEETAKMFRLFELEMRFGNNSVYHRVLVSRATEKILELEHDGLRCLVIHLYDSIQTRAMDEDVLEAWLILISIFADDLDAADAPQESDLLSDWFAWAANHVGIEFTEEEDDESSVG